MTFYQPILCKWLDLRKYAGKSVTTIQGSVTKTCKSDLSVYYSFLDLKYKGWIYTSNNPSFSFVNNQDPVGKFTISPKSELTEVDDLCSIMMENDVYYNDDFVPCLMSQRPLMTIPTETVRETVSYSSSLGGVGYRSSYARVVEWHIDFVFRGIAESETYPLGLVWPYFLKGAEEGVTVYVNGLDTINYSPIQVPILHTPNARNFNASFYKGIPNMITGVLTDCQSTQIAPRDGKLMMHKVSLTIAEKLIPTS